MPLSTARTPRRAPVALAIAAWASFIANVAILGTGGAVRLTGSGLGCPSWPLCTPGSLIPTSELSYHSLIEFGNRLMTGVLSIVAVLVLILIWRLRRQRRDLFTLAWLVLGGVLLQAVVGGVIVLLHLNANLVGFHYIASLVLVALTAVFLVRLYEPLGARTRSVPVPFLILTHLMSLVLAVSVFFGVLTTGAGPHSGDETVQRDGIDAGLMAHIHAWPGYLLVLLTVVLVAWAAARQLRPLPWLLTLLILEAVQVVVGIYQSRNGLPPLSVGVHMVLAGLVVAACVVVVLRLKQVEPAEVATSTV